MSNDCVESDASDQRNNAIDIEDPLRCESLSALCSLLSIIYMCHVCMFFIYEINIHITMCIL